ncbi:glucosamine-6-phosphate deaminase [Shouchella shacheensis]|uniref:glucosamine-6-phosphate deaminase n=1 Tax=Shouchella shacheensis TaxID=1649580 RepID=UPI00073FAE18|nr:glucosamine-6-phosphate deaminase [Shouchella shacheensis]
MNIIRVKDYEEMSRQAAAHLYKRMTAGKRMTMGLATGATPERTYDLIIEKAEGDNQSFHHIHTFNLDEYAGLDSSDTNSYRYYMNQRFFNHIDLPKEQTHLPNGMAPDLEEECHRYEDELKQTGGLDVQLLGIGSNGHIGFNEPGTSFSSRTHVVALTKETREANARYFTSMNAVPKHAITMGIETIMEAKEIILLVSGEAKAEAYDRLLSGGVDEFFPASILKKHPNVLLIADEAASRTYAGRTFS